MHYGLEVREPAEDPARAEIPWLRLAGRVGTAELFESDVVIALDASSSANFPSGLDLDEDGIVGELKGVVRSVTGISQPSLSPRLWTTDPDDTIFQLQRSAARAITLGLSQRRNRIGLLTYVTQGRARAEVGAAAAALAEIDRLRPPGAMTDTDIAAALRRAGRMLERAPEVSGFPRQRAVLLFTDGRPTKPQDEFLGRITAIEAARRLARDDIELYVFTYGQIAVPEAKFLLELAGSGQGRLFRVGAPSRLLDDLPPIDLTPTWLRIENATTGESAEGIEARSDGHFDAFVPLVPGENRIRVLAELGNGKLQRWVGTVIHAPPDTPSAAQELAVEAVLREIGARTGSVDAAAGPPDAAD